jgi:hypothetical protein
MRWRLTHKLAAMAAFAALLASGFFAAGNGGRAEAKGAPPGVLFRPVLCVVPPYDRLVISHQPALSESSCGPFRLTPASTQVVPSTQSASGFNYQSPQPAIILEGERTTTASHDSASRVVLLDGLPGSSVQVGPPTSKGLRYLLGPAVMSSRSIVSAAATKTQTGAWVVDWTTTPAGSAQWDRVARASFHRLLAIDVGGVVVSAPIIEPTQSVFTSFGGRGEVSGGWGRAEATRIASAMQAGG